MKKFQKTLILAFEVIGQPPKHPFEIGFFFLRFSSVYYLDPEIFRQKRECNIFSRTRLAQICSRGEGNERMRKRKTSVQKLLHPNTSVRRKTIRNIKNCDSNNCQVNICPLCSLLHERVKHACFANKPYVRCCTHLNNMAL